MSLFSSGSNQNLSNLTSPTAVNQDLLPQIVMSSYVATAAGSNQNYSIPDNGTRYAQTFTPSTSGNVASMLLHLYTYQQTSGNIKIGIYSNSSGPSTLLGYSNDIPIGSFAAFSTGLTATAVWSTPVQLTGSTLYWWSIETSTGFGGRIGTEGAPVGSGAAQQAWNGSSWSGPGFLQNQTSYYTMFSQSNHNVGATSVSWDALYAGALATTSNTFKIADGSQGTTGHIWTSTDTVGNGHWAAAASGGANTALSNLASTAVNANIVPNTGNTRQLGGGTSGTQWLGVTNLRNFSIKTDDSAYIVMSPQSGLGNTGAGLWWNTQTTNTDPFYIETSSSSTVNALQTANLNLLTGNKTAGTGSSGAISITTGTTVGAASGTIGISVGTTTSTSAPGLLSITGGSISNTASSANAGGVTIQAGTTNSTQSSGAGGTVNINGGDHTGVAAGSIPQAGFVRLKSGAVTGSTNGASGGVVLLTGGDIAGTAGWNSNISIGMFAGNITNGANANPAGGITLTAGNNSGAGSSGVGGSITLTSGSPTSGTSTGASGDIKFVTGTPGGSGSRGKIVKQDGTEGTTGHVWTSTDTLGTGRWSAPSASAPNLSVVSKTTTYTAVTTDDMILASTASGAYTITLYTPSGNSGKVIRIKKTTSDFSVLTISTPAGNLDIGSGSAITTLNTQHESLTLVSDGTNWNTVARDYGPMASTFQFYTPTYGSGFGTTTGTRHPVWKRIPGGMRLIGERNTGTVAASAATISIPSGLTIDSTQVWSNEPLGYCTRNSTAAPLLAVLGSGGGSNLSFARIATAGVSVHTAETGSAAFVSAELFKIDVNIPIEGWK